MKRALTIVMVLAAMQLPLAVHSAVRVQKEELAGTRYRLHYSNDGYRHSLQTAEGKTYISFTGPLVDGMPPEYPSREIFLALPANTRPAVHLTVSRQAQTASDGIANLPEHTALHVTVRGYFWLDNFYCMHVSVSPFWRDAASGAIHEALEFSLDLDLPSAGPAGSTAVAGEVPDAIDNPAYAALWRSRQPENSVARTDTWIDYAQEYLKIGVVQDGIYRMSRSELASFGLPVATIDPRSFKLFMKGREVPLYVSSAQGAAFGVDDYIEFLGRRNYGDTRYRQIAGQDTSYYEYLNRYSDTTIYWLSWAGASGRRVDTVLAQPGIAADTTVYYDHLMHSEANVYWDFALAGGDVRKNSPELFEHETWNEAPLGLGGFPTNFAVTNLHPGKPARAFAKVGDYASSIDVNAHNLALSINQSAVKYDSGYTNKYQGKVLAAWFPSAMLVNGQNTVYIHSFPTQNTINSVIRDWVELEYPRTLIAANDSLDFAYRYPAPSRVSVIAITGVTSPALSLYRFSSADSSIVKITNFSRSGGTLRFVDTVAPGRSYFLRKADNTGRPIVYYKKKFVNLRSSANRADYIAITHPYFKSAAASYASFIGATYKVAAMVVDVNDIYDEFNYGFLAPEPLRDFLRSANLFWQAPKPRTVFLIGKATYDYFGNKHRYFGAPVVTNFVPSYGNPVSDTWFTIWDSTGAMIPQMNIGRLPAKTIDEFQHYFGKHQKYVSKGYDDWNKRFLFFAGGNFTDTVQIAQAKSVNDFIINNYVTKPPVGGISANFYKTAKPVTNFGPYSPEYIKSALDNGGVFISYIGHSGTQTWDNSITDITQLANMRDRNPLITDFGCSTGKFAEPDVYSFSELAVNDAKGQAIAYVGNSSLGFTTTAYSFPQIFYRKLLVDTSVSLGETHRLAKLEYTKLYGSSSVFGLFVLTNSFVGDPIVRLPIPQKPNFSVTNSFAILQPQRLTDQTDSVTVKIGYYNLGKVEGDSVSIQFKDDFRGVVTQTGTIRRKVPLYADSISFVIPIKGKAGEHNLTCVIDPANSVEEIYENDNVLTYKFIVGSSTIRNLALTPSSNQTMGSILLLNPSVRPQQQNFTVEVSVNDAFTSSRNVQVPYDTMYTVVRLDTSYYGKRIWLRTKDDAASLEGLTYSYFYGTRNNYLLNDDMSFASLKMNGISSHTDNLVLDTARIVLSAISGGYNDGNTSVISRNGQNFIPENTRRGFHVCIFDAATYNFMSYHRFDVQAGGKIPADFTTLLDSLKAGALVAVAIANDVASNGANFPAALKASIRQYGSYYIDSVGIADSWSMIGRKGAALGSIPEGYAKRYSGRTVAVDTTIIQPNARGTFETEPIGPVAQWNDVHIRYTNRATGRISLSVLGIKAANSVDTLSTTVLADSIVSLSHVNAQTYPAIKLVGELERGAGSTSPSIMSLAVNYAGLAELGTNYQAVRAYAYENETKGREIAPGDTVAQGGKILLTYRVYNAGGAAAKKFRTTAAAVWDNNSSEPVVADVIDSLAALSYRELSGVYNTSLGSGRRSIRIAIDPDTLVRELFRDNNVFAFPVYVKKDSSKPLLPNLTILEKNIYPLVSPVTDERDSARFQIIYGNTGAFVNDSVTISIRYFYKEANAASWTLRRKYPVEMDTLVLTVPILKRAGNHQLQVELDPVGLIVESAEGDNVVNHYFTVVTTTFKILQPAHLSASAFSSMIFLNPTNASSAAVRIADLELDTLETFATARKLQLPMKEFTTSYDISQLAQGARYYWRIRRQQSADEWTAGSFYHGGTGAYAIGQYDSSGWKSDAYVHAAYGTGGARVVNTITKMKAVSAGFNDGRTGSIELNGNNVLSVVFGTGHNVVVLDTSTYAVTVRRRFDISNSADESDSLTRFIASVATGFIVADVVVDEGSNNLKQSTRDALKTIGSASIDKLAYRDSWAIIGRKGAVVGSVPESYTPQSGGSAAVETEFTRIEYRGTITTPAFGPLSALSAFSMTGSIPAGTAVQTRFVGSRLDASADTVLLTSGSSLLNAQIGNSEDYAEGKIIFDLHASGTASPLISSWRLSARQATELAVSERTASIDRSEVMEGEQIHVTGKIFNVSSAPAESVAVQLSTIENGFEKVLKTQTFAAIAANDSAVFSYSYSTRGKTGSRAFVMKVDPLGAVAEQSKDNNTVTIPYSVQKDSLRPALDVDIDGIRIVDGDYVSRHPVINIRYTDNNPSAITRDDTSNFKIRLNNYPVYFTPGVVEMITSAAPGAVQLKWTPELPDGESIIQIHAMDVSGNSSDTTLLFVKVSSKFMLADVYNLPNPFAGSTHFTFNVLGPVNPDDVAIKIFTVAGRLIQDIPYVCTIGFNKIYWDGRDKDGDEIANGVYFYKVIVRQGDKQTSAISKLVKMK